MYFMLGSVWFGPLFGKPWLRLVGLSVTEEDKKKAPLMFAKTFVLDFIITLSVALVISWIQPETIFHTLKAMTVISMGFVVAPFLGNYMYAKRSMVLFLVESGYHVVCVYVISIILTIWR